MLDGIPASESGAVSAETAADRAYGGMHDCLLSGELVIESADAGEGLPQVSVELTDPPGGCGQARMPTVGGDLADCDEGDSNPESRKSARLAAGR
jgi:hypothetical protein